MSTLLVGVCTVAAIAMVVLMAWLLAVGDQVGGMMSLPVLPISLLVLPAVAIVGVICGVVLVRRGVHRASMIACVTVLAVLAVPFMSIDLARAMVPLFRGVVAAVWPPLPVDAVRTPGEAKETRNTSASVAHYERLKELFQRPQLVVGADRGLLLLEDGIVVKLTGVWWCQARFADFDSLARAALVGRGVRLELPDEPTFMRLYTPGSRSAVFANAGVLPADYAGVRFGIVPVVAYVDGHTALNERYASLPTGP